MQLTFQNEFEARALLRAIIAGKFTSDPSDDDVPASPLVAQVVNRLADMLGAAESDREGDSVQVEWARWRQMTPRREEWPKALSYAERAFRQHWWDWSGSEREEILKTLFSPFVADAATGQLFIKELEARIRATP
jgi:hypothetical protein